VKRAWDAIDTQLIQNSFKCCGISVATDGSEDDLIFNYDCIENNNNKIDNNNEIDEFIFNGKKNLVSQL
ncbi:9006_t:CDS:1, partial [Cetraspora pellucida]